MTRILAITRRLFLGGVATLLILIFLFYVGYTNFVLSSLPFAGVKSILKIYLAISPVLYLISTIISATYIRSNGQFAAYHKTQLPIVSFFRLVGSDIISPFKNFKNFVLSLFSKNVYGRKVIIIRFLEMVLLFIIYYFCIIICR